MLLTKNEKKVLRFLAANPGNDYSINQIAKQCKMSPNGTYKLLKKQEQQGILKAKHIANIISYKLDFSSERTEKVLEFAFMPEINTGKIKAREEDLEVLKKITKICILFGSYTTTKAKPKDIDIFFIVEKRNYEQYKIYLQKAKDRIPLQVQDIVQTEKDLYNNLSLKDSVVVNILKSGNVLWGADKIVNIIKNVHETQKMF